MGSTTRPEPGGGLFRRLLRADASASRGPRAHLRLGMPPRTPGRWARLTSDLTSPIGGCTRRASRSAWRSRQLPVFSGLRSNALGLSRGACCRAERGCVRRRAPAPCSAASGMTRSPISKRGSAPDSILRRPRRPCGVQRAVPRSAPAESSCGAALRRPHGSMPSTFGRPAFRSLQPRVPRSRPA